LRKTGFYRLLVEHTVETPGGQPWAVVGANYTFDDSVEDVMLLGSLGGIAGPRALRFWPRRTRACWARSPRENAAAGELAPHREPARASLEILRNFPEARYLGTGAAPVPAAVALRQETEPAEQFAFEEFEGAPVHEHYLWGNPALACVCLLAQPSRSTVGR